MKIRSASATDEARGSWISTALLVAAILSVPLASGLAERWGTGFVGVIALVVALNVVTAAVIMLTDTLLRRR